MAVERKKEFTIDLSQVVNKRIESFSLFRQRFQAMREADFQRRVVEEDLSFQEQLDYRTLLLEEEQRAIYPDVPLIDSFKTKISELRKLVKARKFRDKYFDFLQELASGRKSLEDHLTFLQGEVQTGAWSQEIKDQLDDKILETTQNKREQDRKIIDAQIAFYKKDTTLSSLDKALSLVNKQLASPIIQKDEALFNGYKLERESLNKAKAEIGIEDKMSSMITSLIGQERQNPSLWKLNTFATLIADAGVDVPINIGGTKYDNEQDYWQMTLNNYVQNEFATEYATENKRAMTVFYNKAGVLTNSFLENITKSNNSLSNNSALLEFPQVVDMAVQGTISEALTLKSKELAAKYYLNQPGIATQGDYTRAIGELENLKTLFGDNYSLSPEIQSVEAGLIQKKQALTAGILGKVEEVMYDPAAYGERADITWEEVIKKYGPGTMVEVPAKEHIEKEPMGIAKETIESGIKMPKLYEKKEKLETQVAEKKTQVDAKKKQVATAKAKVEQKKEKPVTAPAPAAAAAPQRIELPFPKSRGGQTAQQVMTEYREKQAKGEYVFDKKWYKIK